MKTPILGAVLPRYRNVDWVRPRADGLKGDRISVRGAGTPWSAPFKPGAVKDIEGIPTRIRSRVLAKIEEMSDDLNGDVKRLTRYIHEYRLRVGDYRVLFEVEGESIVVYRIRHRREAYR